MADLSKGSPAQGAAPPYPQQSDSAPPYAQQNPQQNAGPAYPQGGMPPYPQQVPYPAQQVPGAYPVQGSPVPQGYPVGVPVSGGMTAVVQQPQVVMMAPLRFTEFPVAMTCGYCRATIQTGTSYEVGTATWLTCLFCFVMTACCFWVAFLIDATKDVVHTCPNCHHVVGRFNRI